MARMFPPELLDAEVKSDAEKRAFAALRDGLPDPWEAFHSASIIVRDRQAGAVDDETDFVLCHPARAVVALEVKGGDLECNHGAWYRAGERIRDPFAQAIDHKHNLRRKLETVGGEGIAVVHAVWFPDLTTHSLVLAPDAPPELVLDRSDLDAPNAAIERVIRFHAGHRDGRRAPGPDGAALVRDLLAPEVRLRVPMVAAFADEAEQLVRLTFEQAAVLNNLHNTRRAAIHGCAGSGKTMLAVERAKRLTAAGRDVLYVCFNNALAQHLRHAEADSGVTFSTFHALCKREAHAAGVRFEEPPDPKPPSWWKEDLPALLMEAVSDGGRFDAVVVDEAQDFDDDWLVAAEATLRDPSKDPFWLFLDDNQRIYDQKLTVTDDFLRWDLTINCRNTRAIHQEVMKLYVGDIQPDVRGPAGRPVELHRTTDQPKTVLGVVARLCRQEEVPQQDVVVLSAHAPAKSAVAQALQRTFPRVRCSSIRGFKGLDAPVVALCELEDLEVATREQQLYVGLSRARHHCVIVAPAIGA